MDLDINKIIKFGCKSKSKLCKKFIYWFCKHYFYCDIHPNNCLSSSVNFAHNGLGTVINENAVIGAGTVVTKSVPAGATVVGNPAHIIKIGGRDA